MLYGSELKTARLTIRPFRPDDVEPLVSLFADPLVHEFVDDGLPLSRDVARLWVARSNENLARFGFGTGAVVENASGRLIGWAGFARPGDGGEELIYGLAAGRWGLGLGRELLASLLRFAESRAISPVRATVDPRNDRSIALLTAAGFTLAGRGHRGDPDSDLYLLT